MLSLSPTRSMSSPTMPTQKCWLDSSFTFTDDATDQAPIIKTRAVNNILSKDRNTIMCGKMVYLDEKIISYLNRSHKRRFPLKSIHHFSKQYPDTKERVSVLMEIVASQRNYVKFLMDIQKYFYYPMVYGIDNMKKNNFDKPFVDQMTCSKMFPDVFSEILETDMKFLNKLDERIQMYTSEDYYFMMIGDIFLHFADYFSKYSEYMVEYEKCSDLIREHRETNLRFAHWLARRKKLNGGQDICSLLIMPVQRVMRHKLLLEKLLSKTDTSHGEYDVLFEALETISHLADYHNEKVRDVNNEKKMKHYSKLLKVKNLSDPNRQLVAEGNVFIDNRTYELILFSDVVFFRNEKQTFHYELLKVSIGGGSKCSIWLSCKNSSLELNYETFEIKQHWLTLFENTLRAVRTEGISQFISRRPLQFIKEKKSFAESFKSKFAIVLTILSDAKVEDSADTRGLRSMSPGSSTSPNK
ncbi:hypothetical protein AKO1_006351 [Acrasis kona]|uniref:DH domain-containing protein n=1 Tax=Acrasis kona TaxID=1008807 RepID=A0AAW2YJ43_9EUKA